MIQVNKIQGPSIAIASGNASVLLGPIALESAEDMAIHVQNCASIALVLSYKVSINTSRELEGNLPLDANLDNTAITIAAQTINVASFKNPNLGYAYLTILGSATASIGASETRTVVTSKIIS